MSESYLERDKRLLVEEEVRAVVERYPDQLMSRVQLRELSNMLFVVNVIIFGIVTWIACGYLLPANGDTRPAWSIWFIWAPLGGFFFGGVLGGIGWTLAAHWLGGFLLYRQQKPLTARWWHRLIGESKP